MPSFLLGTVLGVSLFWISSGLDPASAKALTGTSDIQPLCVAFKVTALAALLPIAHPCDFLGNAPLLTVMAVIGLYVVYGLVVSLNNEALIYSISIVSAAAGLFIAALNLRYPLLYNWWQNSSLFAFLPYWWIGAAMAAPPARKMLARWLPTLVLARVSLTVFSHLEQTAIAAELRKVTLAALVALLIVALEEAPIPSNPLSYIGKAGYSIYALHAPLCVLLLILGVSWWGVVSSAVAVGLLCYFAFERPLDRVGRRLAPAAANVGPRSPH
jgi:hypothetical protein